jgi:hypothetical protein
MGMTRKSEDAATEPLIGVINAGSSSLKFSFHEAEVLDYPGGMPGDIGFFLTWKQHDARRAF